MATSFQPRSSHSPWTAEDDQTVTDQGGQAGRYLTDGIELFRFLGAVHSAMGEMVELENCFSLDVVLVPVGELYAQRLRVVIPAAHSA